MSRAPRYIKLQDIPAHGGNVNCIKIGTKSSGVLVTGGDDKKVNLWTIGTQTKALSLQGHQTPVDSVTFDHNEELVAAGAASGSIKIFDLDQAKVTRAMSGHRSNVLCLELSQYGLLSGSMDTNVKVWDLRGRDVMCTFKGHHAAVKHVKFSPDGKWVASASEDGQVKIWDLVANKLLAELAGHTHSVTGLHFHPVEYLLGTCSTDKTVKIWDLETMGLVETTPSEATGVRAMAFHPDGRTLFSALQDGLRVWSWEPPPCLQHDIVDMPWYKVADISVLPEKNKLIGCSFNQNFVGLWVVDLRDVRPFGGSAAGAGDSRGLVLGAGMVPRTGSVSSVARSDSDLAHGDGPYQRDRSQSASSSSALPGRAAAGAYDLPGQHRASAGDQGAAVGGARSRSGGRAAPLPGVLADPPVSVVAPAHAPQQLSRHNSAGSGGGAAGNPGAPRYLTSDSSTDAALVGGGGRGGAVPPRHTGPIQLPPAPAPAKSAMVSVGCGVGDSLMRGQDPVQMARDEARLSANAAAQAQQQQRQQQAAAPSSRAAPLDSELLASINGKHDQVKSALAFRLSNLQLSRNFVQRGDLRGALSAVRRCGDATVGADLLAGILARRDPMFELHTVPDLVPVVEQVLSLPSDRQVQAGLELATMMYRAFHQIIRDTCSQAARVGVDLSFEQRREKCMTARLSLQGLAPKLGHVARQLSDATLAYKAKDLAAELQTL